MKIIHDEHDDPMASTLILAISWHLPEECQVRGCGQKTAAIMCLTADESPTEAILNISICEEHYQKGLKDGKFSEELLLTL